MANTDVNPPKSPIPGDTDPVETAEWLESLDYVLESKGPERVQQLLTALGGSAHRNGVELPFTATTPYVNTISRDKQPPYPGNRELERRIKSFVRWNAMAHGHARQPRPGRTRRTHLDVRFVGYTLRGCAQSLHPRSGRRPRRRSGLFPRSRRARHVFACFSRRTTDRTNLVNFRRELSEGGGLSSYPHPWPDAGLLGISHGVDGSGTDHGDLSSAFQRVFCAIGGIVDTSNKRVWAFLGDGGMRRTRNARRYYAGVAREAQQPHLCDQLQSPATRRTGARQR